MTHITPKTPESIPELAPVLKMVEASMGFVPNSMLTMAHWPELMTSFSAFAGPILNSGEIDPALKQLIAFVVSNAAGCRYCQAHTSHSAENRGVSPEKIQAAFEYKTSDLFTAAEKAALDVALHAGMVPNAVDAAKMKTLSDYYSEREIVEIVAVISLFGFLNRWNDTMASTLEETPKSFATNKLVDRGWDVGKHA